MPNCRRAAVYSSVISSSRSSAPAIAAVRASAPRRRNASTSTPGAAGAIVRGLTPSKCTESRGSPARFTAASMRASSGSTCTTMGPSLVSSSATISSTARAQGTRCAVPWSTPSRSTRSSRFVPGTTVTAPCATSRTRAREEPTAEHAGLRERQRYCVTPTDAHDLDGVGQRAARSAGGLRHRHPGQACLGDRIPDGRRPAVGFGLLDCRERRSVGEHAGRGLGQQRVDTGRAHVRNPLAATERRISMVPPRMVNTGAVRMALARRRSNNDDESGTGSTSA